MREAVFLLDQFAFVDSKKDHVRSLCDHILDLGVHRGGSTRRLARIFPEMQIHGFDSFEGLPEDWSYTLAGTFGLTEGYLPDMPPNVELHKGWFDETLPAWSDQHAKASIALLRVDCDIYSSTETVFDVLGGFLGPGSWVLFDELIGYRG